jgi:hypothetical protein
MLQNGYLSIFCLDFELSISKDGYLFVYTFIISIVKENLSHQP